MYLWLYNDRCIMYRCHAVSSVIHAYRTLSIEGWLKMAFSQEIILDQKLKTRKEIIKF